MLIHVVFQLIEPYIGCSHHIFTDRYYSSLTLASTLQSLNTSFTGTITKRVDLPVNVCGPQGMRDAEVVAYRADHLLTLAWQAHLLTLAWQAEKKKKLVIMLSTTCSVAMTVLTPPSRKPPVSKPAIVDCYNHFMNGVDIADQQSVYYRFIRKTVKWWKKIAFWLIETSMVNSYILYKLTVASPKSPAAYRRSVME